MLESILINIVFQLIYFIVVVFLFGYIISLINKMFYKFTNNNKTICYLTGLIGTPIHELSHAVMCVVFMHKIHEIKLFHIDKASGTLGYVKHSYKKKSLYQTVGNYFIGTAPIVVGTLFIYVLIKFMLPSVFSSVNMHIEDFATAQSSGFNSDLFIVAVNSVFGIVGDIFSGIATGAAWWIFIVLAFSIALHMNLSSLDIKGSLKALPFLIIALAIANFFLGFVFTDLYSHFVSFMNTAGSYLSGVLILSLVLSGLCCLVAFAIRTFIRLITHR